MSDYIRLAINVPSLAGTSFGARPAAFDYRVPESLRGIIDAGHLVLAPFGSRTVQGVVLQLLEQPSVSETKEIIDLVDSLPVMTSAQLALAGWLASETLGSLSSIVGLFLPPGLDQQVDSVYSLRAQPIEVASQSAARPSGRSTAEARLLRLLAERGSLRGRQIDRAMPHFEWRRSAQSLVRRGLLDVHSTLPPASVRPKFIRTAQLAVAPAVAQQEMASLGSTPATQLRREKALGFLVRQPQAVNVSWVYAESGCNLADLQELDERELIVLREQEIWRDPLNRLGSPPTALPAAEPVTLTAEQDVAWAAIQAGLTAIKAGQAAQPYLLQGVTGSGKTELYLRATRQALQQGKQAIVLVPEISLTPQTVDRFVAHFPGQVGLLHSKLSDGEQYDTWRRARSGALRVIIGPRSALFAPLPALGLLVVDECHDASYYQSEPPFFNAVAATQEYARLCGALCILGSATPSVVQRYQAETGGTIRLVLPHRVASSSIARPAPEIDLPPVHLVDMREELKAGNRSSLSRALTSELRGVLQRGEQAILFLNRRGTATHVFCRNCGYVVRCPRCDTPMTCHTSGGERLLCHRCGYARHMPRTCPDCGAADIRAYGLGTERVETEVQRLWPAARTLRWDWETTRQKASHEIILSHFQRGKADVLIGTQMLAKSLDLPRLTLVGIVLADVGLFLPDAFAAERVFQVLTQVAGRAGRSVRGGTVVLQTFAPGHYAIQAASRHDVDGFYAEELQQRRRLGYPPFSRLMRLEYRHFDAIKAEEEARRAAAFLKSRLAAGENAAMIGPAPCFFSRLDGKYRWQIVLRGDGFASLLDGRRFEHWRIEVDPASLL